MHNESCHGADAKPASDPPGPPPTHSQLRKVLYRWSRCLGGSGGPISRRPSSWRRRATRPVTAGWPGPRFRGGPSHLASCRSPSSVADRPAPGPPGAPPPRRSRPAAHPTAAGACAGAPTGGRAPQVKQRLGPADLVEVDQPAVVARDLEDRRGVEADVCQGPQLCWRRRERIHQAGDRPAGWGRPRLRRPAGRARDPDASCGSRLLAR